MNWRNFSLLYWFSNILRYIKNIVLGSPTDTAVTEEFHLDDPLLDWGDNNILTVEKACGHIAIFGRTGAGKSTGSLQALARAFLTAGFGGIITTVKIEDAEFWRELGKATGRLDDMIFFNPSNSYKFSFMNYALKNLYDGAGVIENLTAMLVLACRAGTSSTGESGGDNDRFWSEALKQLIRAVLSILHLTGNELSLPLMTRVIRDLPTSSAVLMMAANPDKPTKEEKAALSWQNSSFAFQLLCQGKEMQQAGELGEYAFDYEITASYMLKTFPELGDKTRTSIVISFDAMADSLLRQPLRSLLSEETNITPDMTLEGKIIVLDLPLHRFELAGARGQICFHYLWTRMIENRDLSQNNRPCFWIADEASAIVDAQYTPAFLSTCRSKRVMCVLASQDYSSYILKFGGRNGREAADRLLANCSTRIFHNQIDSTTNTWASESIGRIWQNKRSSGQTTESAGGSRSTSSHMHQIYEVQIPTSFYLSLKTGGTKHGLIVEGLVTGGELFNNGLPYMLTSFPQVYEDKTNA